MAIPSSSPVSVPRAYCPITGHGEMRVIIKGLPTGKITNVLLCCDKCQWTFDASFEYINGVNVKYVAPEPAEKVSVIPQEAPQPAQRVPRPPTPFSPIPNKVDV